MVVVETYRGFDIMFSPDKETFSCIPSDEDVKESKSFAACKRHIDEYLKLNQGFKPFTVSIKPENYRFSSKKQIKIVGIRKDNKFVYEEDGQPKQLSDWNDKDYLIEFSENTHLLKEYEESEDRLLEFSNKERELQRQILSKMKIKTLADYKKELLGK